MTTQFTTETAPTFVKTITYDRAERCYRAELDGEIKGYYRDHLAAEVALNNLVYDLLDEQVVDTAQAADDEYDFQQAMTPEATPLEVLEIEQLEEDTGSSNYGKRSGTTYRVDTGMEWYEMFVPDPALSTESIELYALDKMYKPAEFERMLPAIMALLGDPRVQQARAARAA